MATLSVTAVPEPDAQPPQVRIEVVDAGNSPAITSVTVTRTIGGETVAVRSNDGNPLQLEPSGTDTRFGVISDPELFFGEEAVYSTLQQPSSTSDPVTVNSDQVWLTHPGLPILSRPVNLRAGSFRSRKRPAKTGVFYPQNRNTAIVVTDGRRKKPESSFIVSTETAQEFEQIEDLIDDAGILLLNVPPQLGLLIKSAYIAVLDVDEDRRSDIGEDPQRDWVMPYVEVARPVGGTPTSWTWADVMATYPTWQDVIDANRTWADLLEPI
jgi:hypothetical protein